MDRQIISGYHFSNGARLRDGRPLPPIGEWLVHEGPIVPGSLGLQCSEHPFDALSDAFGSTLHRVELTGDLQPEGDPPSKWVGRRRRRVASIDATDMLRAYARWCAQQVVGLWDAPEAARQFLATGDPALRAAFYAAHATFAPATFAAATAFFAAFFAAYTATAAAAADAATFAAAAIFTAAAANAERSVRAAKARASIVAITLRRRPSHLVGGSPCGCRSPVNSTRCSVEPDA